jgi:hypothetical protein
VDVLGVTFDEIRAALGAAAHQVKALRAEYRAALAGRSSERMHADLLPVVRCLEDGDLTKFIQRTHDGLEIESVMVPMRRTARSGSRSASRRRSAAPADACSARPGRWAWSAT